MMFYIVRQFIAHHYPFAHIHSFRSELEARQLLMKSHHQILITEIPNFLRFPLVKVGNHHLSSNSTGQWLPRSSVLLADAIHVTGEKVPLESQWQNPLSYFICVSFVCGCFNLFFSFFYEFTPSQTIVHHFNHWHFAFLHCVDGAAATTLAGFSMPYYLWVTP